MTPRTRFETLPLIAALSIYVLLTVPRGLAIVHYDPDVVENLDIIRHLVRGDGFISTFRTYYFGPEGFPQPPQLIRPILYPLLVWPLYAVMPSVYALQMLGVALGVANLLLVRAVLRPQLPRGVALASVAVLGSMWVFARNHLLALPEPLSLTLPLLALWVAAPHQGSRRSAPLLLGLLLGLSVLAKPATLPLLPVIVAYDLYNHRAHRRPLPLAALAAGLLLTWLPLLRLNLMYGLSPFYASAGAQFTVFEPLDLMWTGFDRPPSPPVLDFIGANARQMVVAVVRNWRDNLDAMVTAGGLAYLLVFLGPALILWRRRGINPLEAVLVALSLVNLVFYSMKWSPAQPQRYLFLSIVFAVPPLVAAMHAVLADVPLRSRGGRIGAFDAAVVVVVAVYAFLSLNDVRDVLSRRMAGQELRGGARNEIEADPDFRAAIAAAVPHLAEDAVVAASEPWIWGYLSGRPFALLPQGVSRETLERFLRLYEVRLVVLTEHQPWDASNQAYAGWLASRPGTRRLRVRGYEMFLLPDPGHPTRRAAEAALPWPSMLAFHKPVV